MYLNIDIDIHIDVDIYMNTDVDIDIGIDVGLDLDIDTGIDTDINTDIDVDIFTYHMHMYLHPRGFLWAPSKGSTIDFYKWQHGCRRNHAGFPSFWLGHTSH